MENAHWPCTRALDYNPHRAHLLASGGDDGYLRIWDLRYLKSRHQCAPTPSSTISNPTSGYLNLKDPNNSSQSNLTNSQLSFGGMANENLVEPLFAKIGRAHV